MLLEHKYFEMTVGKHGDGTAEVRVRLLPGCEVYRGHFPGHPVAPGACNIEMVRECFARMQGADLRIAAIDRCRFTAVATPTASPELAITLSWTHDDGGYRLAATMTAGGTTYMDFKGTLK